MRRIILLSSLFFAATTDLVSLAAGGKCSGTGRVSKVYVIRHPLKEVPDGMKLCPSVLSHSALLLETATKQQCVLEFLPDGTHLYDAKPRSTRRCPFPQNCVRMRMMDDSGHEFLWERSLHAQVLPEAVDVSPRGAQAQMRSLMGNHYNVFFNNCHMAQQRLREKWGLTVKKPFKILEVFCLCLKFCRK